MGFTSFFGMLLGFTEFQRVFLVFFFCGIKRILIGLFWFWFFSGVWLGFTGFYWISIGLT